MDKIKIQKYLNVIRKAAALIEAELYEEDNILEVIENEEPQRSISKPPKGIPEVRLKHMEGLMKIGEWPEAVPNYQITSEGYYADKANRASSILDMLLNKPLDELDFLDFGCGEGYVVEEALKRGASTATGYDLEKFDTWKTFNENAVFTQSLQEVISKTYDVILLHDVLDHCEDSVKVMNDVRNIIKPDGIVYVRCHPWTSKHATHLYKQGINKAYFHLFLCWEEIRHIINEDPIFTRNEKNPLEAYHWWFRNFEIKRESIASEDVNSFFHQDFVKKLIAEQQEIPNHQINDFLEKMKIQFVTYILLPK